MIEKDIENYLLKRCKQQSWYAPKFTSPGRRSVPDRIVIMPGRIAFVELKAPGQKPTAKQLWEHQRLGNLGHEVHILDSHQLVDNFVEMMCA